MANKRLNQEDLTLLVDYMINPDLDKKSDVDVQKLVEISNKSMRVSDVVYLINMLVESRSYELIRESGIIEEVMISKLGITKKDFEDIAKKHDKKTQSKLKDADEKLSKIAGEDKDVNHLQS